MSEDKDGLFSYHDGTQTVYGDPRTLDRRFRMALRGEDMQRLLKLCSPPREGEEEESDEAVNHAVEKVLGAIQAAFDVKPVQKDGSGLREDKQFRMLSDFFGFLQRADEPAASSPTASPPMEPASSDDPLPLPNTSSST